MYNISDAFKEAITQSHKIVYKAELYTREGELITNDLEVVSGNINVDATASSRRRARVTLAVNRDLVPFKAEATHMLHPLSSNELRLYRGIQFNNGTQELVPLGVFVIFDTSIDDTRDGLTVELNLFDRARKVERARLLQNYSIEPGVNYGDAIRGIIDDGVPGLKYNFPSITHVTPKLTFGSSGDLGGGDRWKYAMEMAESIGHELYFNLNGIVTLAPIPNIPDNPVVWHYREGRNSTLLYTTRNLSIENTFNTVVARGESTSNDEPIQYIAMDEEPNSPTYVGDPPGTSSYGIVPTFLNSKYITSEEQAEEVAKAKLRAVLGTTEKMRVMVTVNPAHEAGDVVRVTRARSRIACKYVLDKFNIPLEYNVSMNFTMREGRDR